MWEYAPAPENRDIANLKPSYRMFVDGEFVDGAGEPLKTVNPATEEVLSEVAAGSEADVDRAVRAATGRQVGVKPAGGIRTTKDAVKHLVLINETVGADWLSPDWFRFGASSLLNDLLLQRQKLRTGHYSGPDHVSVD